MHFVTGGAFNGKRAWVLEKYPDAKWISAYDGNKLIEDVKLFTRKTVVLEGIEVWMKLLCEKRSISQARSYWKNILDRYLKWEQAGLGRERNIIFIGTDITKGIVPVEEANRNWRDLTGWAYQDLTCRCKRVDVIWYGINQTIKLEREEEM